MSFQNASIGFVVLVTLGCLSLRAAEGETLILKGGGQIVGEVIDNAGSAEGTVTIKTREGVRITVAESQIEKRVRQRPGELEYEKIRPSYPDTVEGQWELAEWCRERSLTAQRETHLKRIVELEPNHEKAHFGLGHTRINGQWTTQEEVMRKQGMVFYKGRWRLPQEKELEEEKRRTEMAEKEWKKKLRQWRQQLGSNRDASAKESIRTLNAPTAVKALGDAMREDSAPAVRLLYVEAFAKIGDAAAKAQLAAYSLLDPNEEVRLTCLDHLKKERSPDTVKFYVGRLRDKDNQIVNRAASALREMGDKSAIGPLIDALVTVHKQKINMGSPGQIGASFGSGGSGMSAGGGGVKIIAHHLSNRPVLEALVSLTGGINYQFDVPQWKRWYAAQRQSQILDSRRN